MAHVRPTLQPHVKCFPFCKERYELEIEFDLKELVQKKFSLNRPRSGFAIIFRILSTSFKTEAMKLLLGP